VVPDVELEWIMEFSWTKTLLTTFVVLFRAAMSVVLVSGLFFAFSLDKF